MISFLLFKCIIGFFMLSALAFTLWLIFARPHFDLYFMIVQGATNIGLFFMYIKVYLKFYSYHADILAKYDRIFSEQEKAQINHTTSEVKKFFLYIQ